jgi:integrase
MKSAETQAFLEKEARLSTSKEAIRFIESDATISKWFNGSTKNPRTKYGYGYRLLVFFKKLAKSPAQFLKELESDYKTTKIEAKGIIASLANSQSLANQTIDALKDFTRFYEVQPKLELEYLPRKRKRQKRREEWKVVERVIDECPVPYRDILRFMLWTGIDEHTFGLINSNAPEVTQLNGGDVHLSLQRQMKNDKPYVRIDLPPRKSSNDTYFILAPKIYVPTQFPLRSIEYKGRGGILITSRRLQSNFRTAAKALGVWHPGYGPHTLRSIFRTRCAELGIPEVAEWQLGRGSDIYGYAREGFDEKFILEGPVGSDGEKKGGLTRLWESAPIVDRQTIHAELSERDGKIEQLRTELTQLQEAQKVLDRILKETTGYGVIQGTNTETGKQSGIGIYLADRKKLEDLADRTKKARPTRKKGKSAT